MSLSNQVAVITGGGRGIGLACARFLARDGAAVVLATPEDEERTTALEELQDAGHRALGTATDVTSESDLSRMVEETLDHFGRIDILVNNAGIIGPTAELQNVQRHEWEAVMAVNVTGMYLACRAVLPHMISRAGGRIINIASDAGRVGSSGESIYSACKGGTIAFTKTLARETARGNIRVNCVCPGPTETALLEGFAGAGEFGRKVYEGLKRAIPVRRLGLPEDLAGLVTFLASEEADFITGQTISVSGGLTMHG